ncbi:MAG: heparinase II/III family protein [Mariniphaga sp.]|nr:heparinase II/III family protein [Mariniphaga sp.]
MMKTSFFSLLLLFLMISGITFAQKWQEINSVEDVCKAYPNEMKKMLGEFNLNYPGMEKVKIAWEAGNLAEACNQLLDYYKNSENAEHLRKTQTEKSGNTEAEADTILKNVFVIQNVRGQVPWGDDGHRDWYWKGPNNDREWAWLSNRHSQINHVFDVYYETGNPKYAEYVDLFLRDFIIKSMPYPAKKGSESIWRGLEVSFRAKVWSRIFYGMLNNEYLSPATRLLILSSLPDHAHYNRNFHGGNNWLTMEISALATVATNFPEYKKSEEWLDYSIGAMVESMKDQVYPDGVQTELTSHYHNVSLSNFELFKEICDRVNKSLPEFFNQTIEDMYFYIAHAVRPDGNRILNNDGDRGSDRERILKGAEKFNKSDWEYIVTNGQSGTKPTDGPSYFFPWAGHLISRNGFDADAHWSFFDIGPWGSGHQHNDKLHISIAAYGRDLLVDAGRFAYTGEVAEKFRPYARGSQGHNVLLIDGKGQGPGPRLAEEAISQKHWLITDEYDYAWSSFDQFAGVEGKCEHTRRLFYARGDLWVVVDQVKTDRPRKIEALWHWHPDCEVGVEGNRVFTQNEKGNLQVIPVGKREWKITFIEGQEEPEIQGWYSEEYNKYEPNVASIYSTNIESDSKFVWVLFPSEKVETGIQAEIISESIKEIKLKVWNEKNDKWVIDVPLE